MSAPIEHWWVILSSDSAYYSINIWVNDVINVYRTQSWSSANEVGLACAGKDTDSDVWTEKNYSCNRSLKSFLDYIRDNVSDYYSLASNNCQDVSKKIYNFS